MLWLRGDGLDVIWRNLRPALRLRMGESPGAVGDEHLGMVLNVLDRDGDGWGELVFPKSGYESRDIAEWRFSPSGFARTTVALSYGRLAAWQPDEASTRNGGNVCPVSPRLVLSR